MAESVWTIITPYCAQHKETGHRVCKIGDKYEVWYKVGTTYKQGGMSDKETAMREASKP